MDVSRLLADRHPLDDSSSASFATRSRSARRADSSNPYAEHRGDASPGHAHVRQEQQPNVIQQSNGLVAKEIKFPLMLSDGSQYQARLPLRVNVNPHDTTESIISTVKNFYGLYEGQGVSFERDDGLALIPCYENLPAFGTVQVRLMRDSAPPHDNRDGARDGLAAVAAVAAAASPVPLAAAAPTPLGVLEGARLSPGISRPGSRSALKRTESPPGRIGRPMLSRADQGSDEDDDHRSASFSSSRRAKSDLLASAEISTDNIVEGNRRLGAKFESSVLPLFIPPQIPYTISASSASPQKHHTHHDPLPLYNTHSHSHALNINTNGNGILPPTMLPSPRSIGASTGTGNGAGAALNYGAPPRRPGNKYRSDSILRGRAVDAPLGLALPTPDPTIRSTISDEDVALQLMRLGNASHGRTSTSTLDDTLSGKAVHASSESDGDASSEDEGEGEDDGRYGNGNGNGKRLKSEKKKAARPRKKQKLTSHSHPHMHTSGSTVSMHASSLSGSGSGAAAASTSASGVYAPLTLSGATGLANAPVGAFPSRKNSTASSVTYQLASDEEDLSTKPRCQRCRKSKKGCDRQRPCGRCRDAGIGIEGCVSEDEGNGRKGRFGRVMGVAIKRPGDTANGASGASASGAMSAANGSGASGAVGGGVSGSTMPLAPAPAPQRPTNAHAFGYAYANGPPLDMSNSAGLPPLPPGLKAEFAPAPPRPHHHAAAAMHAGAGRLSPSLGGAAGAKKRKR